ncbi:hypothetical protein BH20ACT3_BH20ACT3_12430 [soil metagenome]
MCDHLLTSQRPAHGWLDDVALMIVDRIGPAA